MKNNRFEKENEPSGVLYMTQMVTIRLELQYVVIRKKLLKFNWLCKLMRHKQES
jgi:hypothetical protein